MAAYWAWIVVLTLAYYAFSSQKLLLWSLIGGSGAAAVLVGALINRPRRRLPWLLVALALFVFTAGDAVYLVLTDVLGQTNPFPSIADVFYLAMYPLLVAGLLLLPHSSTGRDRGGIVDALVFATGLGLLSWIFLISPYLEAEDLTTLQRLTSVAYPVSDVLFLVAAALLLTSVPSNAAVRLMAAGGGALLTTDVIYGLAQLSGAWSMGGVVDFGWIVFYATWGAAALHPSMTELTEPKVIRDSQVTGLRMAILTGAALIPPAVLYYQSTRGHDVDAVPIAILSGVVFLLVLLRLAGVVRSYRHATERERSLRQAGAALVAATDVTTVREVVLNAIDRLFASGTSYEAALPFADSSQVGDGFLHKPGPTRFIHTESMTSGSLTHIKAHEIALASPLVVTDRRTGSPIIGTLVVSADDQHLGALQSTLEVLAAQAALAIDRINLNAEVARRDSEQYFRTLVQNATDVILIVDEDGRVRYASPSAASVFGDAPVLSRQIADLVVRPQRELAQRALDRVRVGEDQSGMSYWSTQRPDGSAVEVEASFRDLRDEPTVRGIVFTLRDVTEQRRLDRELKFLAFHDPLTGLVNRVRFADEVRRAVADSIDRRDIVGVLFIDVDDFKMINDTMGHEIGDQLLEVVGSRLSSVVNKGCTAARLGGDEFAVLIERAANIIEIEHLADKILDALAEPVALGGSMLTATASIGVATTADAMAKGDLLRQADLALYVAKNAGKGRWRRYQIDLHEAMVKKMELRSALDRALAREEFTLVYQPIVRLEDEAPVGLEALLRWVDLERGFVPPSEFIDVAEESGLIVPIGNWALRRAVADAAEWSDRGAENPPYLSLNFSVRQFHHPELIDTILEELARSGLPPQQLQLEITESLLLRDDERVWADLARLREIGIRVAIDDFGTGYSSLSYLRQVAIDVMKIDRSFVDAMGNSTQQRALVETIVRMAQTLGLDVVAEGIEHPDDRDLLFAMGCVYGQGYLFAKPMTQHETLRWLGEHSHPRLL
jgi:diguanylate cyclase (GGDEF)-like protein/PAS domain S-box-containing protein